MNYDATGAELAEIALLLQESIECPDLSTPRAAADRRRVDVAAQHVIRAAELLLEVDAPPLAPEVEALSILCQCGLDLGDHLVELPHASEDGQCQGFAPARLRDLMTEPAPAPSPEVA
jgi:hypothetical protein